MSEKIKQIMEQHKLCMEYETDARDRWPARWLAVIEYVDTLEAKIAELEQANAVMREALEDARSAISTLPINALGTGRSGELEWPIRDELLDKITKALD